MKSDEWGYNVQDDSNGNGHWDSDRNGWLDGGATDHERGGSGHNIHMAAVDAPLGRAKVNNWSAGCQVIPGMDNWIRFLESAWEGLDTEVSYYLVDTRDISPNVWADCEPDGSHECPYEIGSFPYSVSGDTSVGGANEFDEYNCSTADESGPEDVYFFTTDSAGTLSISVDSDELVDVDIHLLVGDDANACRERAHISLENEIGPGRYFIVVDSWVDDGEAMSGGYTLHVDLD
jgi:hypothetical protein